jgi:dephospho-CoA kinase
MEAANVPLAVVGMACAGKSEVSAELLDSHGFQSVYFGQVVLDEIAARGLEAGPQSERYVREELRRADGMDVMAKRSLGTIKAELESGRRVCIDGLYSGAEWQLLAREVGLVTLAVHAPRWLRKQRAANRPGRPLSAAELDERDLAEVRNVDKATPIALADLQVVNDGNLDDLATRIALLMQRLSAAASARVRPPST